MGRQYDVAIVGGGVVGSAVAYYLEKHGFGGSVAIVEKDTTYANSCTARSAGGIRQQFSTPENIALSRFGLKLIRDLKSEFGSEADVSFREQGYLILASPEGLPVLNANHALQFAEGADNIILTPADLAARFPWIVSDGLGGGCFGLSGEGWLDPYSLMTLFRKAATAKGAEILAGEVAAIIRDEGTVAAIALGDGERIGVGALVNAAGAGAGMLAALAGIALPVNPRKRYVYVLDCPSASEALHRAPLTVDPSGIYFRPEGKHFICGLSPEEQDEPKMLDWEVDYGWFEERIWPGLAARVPAFEAVKVINAWVGHYDYNSFDQNAVIGRHPELVNFYFANGFSGHGLQQAPAAGNAIAELITLGEYRAIDLSRFGYERIAAATPLYEQNVI
jgi:FAD-dependent oxidoreductase domain-containing protein 1